MAAQLRVYIRETPNHDTRWTIFNAETQEPITGGSTLEDAKARAFRADWLVGEGPVTGAKHLDFTGASMSDLRNALRTILQAEGVDVQALDTGSQHSYNCDCPSCWSWWRELGLGDEEGSAPFTQQQLEAPTYEAAMALARPKWRFE